MTFKTIVQLGAIAIVTAVLIPQTGYLMAFPNPGVGWALGLLFGFLQISFINLMPSATNRFGISRFWSPFDYFKAVFFLLFALGLVITAIGLLFPTLLVLKGWFAGILVGWLLFLVQLLVSKAV
jgi:hypothetical protein